MLLLCIRVLYVCRRVDVCVCVSVGGGGCGCCVYLHILCVSFFVVADSIAVVVSSLCGQETKEGGWLGGPLTIPRRALCSAANQCIVDVYCCCFCFCWIWYILGSIIKMQNAYIFFFAAAPARTRVRVHPIRPSSLASFVLVGGGGGCLSSPTPRSHSRSGALT